MRLLAFLKNHLHANALSSIIVGFFALFNALFYLIIIVTL